MDNTSDQESNEMHMTKLALSFGRGELGLLWRW
jgi:hypothetical protein